MSNVADDDTVEVIERWVTGGATEYSVDGGTVWWTKEQWKVMQALIHRTQVELPEEPSDD